MVVEGGAPLSGRISVSGAKNAALVLIAASMMAEGETFLENVPHIKDVEVMIQILNELGVKSSWCADGSLSIISTGEFINVTTPYELTKQVRASNLFLGALLGRQAEAAVSMPGGCDIGSRPMDLHLKGAEALGVKIRLEHGNIYAEGRNMQGARVYLDFPSVGATENIIMMACKTPGLSIIENAAKEPEIIDLSNFLNSMGADIRGAGTDLIKIKGVERLHAGRYSIIPDRIEAGTYMLAAAASRGEVLVENVIPTHLHPVIAKLQETGCTVEEQGSALYVKAADVLTAVDVKTLPYPGFPTDMQSQIMALLLKARGNSVIVENVFEKRFQIVDELKRMGARIKIEGRTAIVEGLDRIYGAKVKATDLRAGAGLIIAALSAEGTTVIDNAVYIFRGYERVAEKFRFLGADIRVE